MNRYTVSFSADNVVAEIAFRDRFVAHTILPAILELKRLGDYQTLQAVMWDLRQADLSDLTIDSLREIFRSKNELAPAKQLRVACVVSTETDSHILKLWAEGFDDEKPNLRRWFLDKDEAIAWLRQDDRS